MEREVKQMINVNKINHIGETEKHIQMGYVSAIYLKIQGQWKRIAYSKFERVTNYMLSQIEEEYLLDGVEDSAYLDINIPLEKAIEILNKRG